jgi:hypothetical protein
MVEHDFSESISQIPGQREVVKILAIVQDSYENLNYKLIKLRNKRRKEI